MAVRSKDSEDVARFLGRFAQLREWIDDNPLGLVELAERDESVRELCKRLAFDAYILRWNENSRPERFATPVDPSFTAAWRDFEERYTEPVEDVDWRDIIAGIAGLPDFPTPEPQQALAAADLRWEVADSTAEDAARAINGVFEFAKWEADSGRDFQEDTVEDLEVGLREWARLRHDYGFDLRGVLRRRHLIPFVLVPRQLAASYGNSDKVSLLTNLRSAHDAFVFGAPLAALAMMRSILEAVLRDHYGAEGTDLSERIWHARDRLPKQANVASLHRLRRRANAVLHLDGDKLPVLDTIGLEKEIVSLLLVLRALIESAPAAMTRRSQLGG
ncbi:MAG TPA: DUF4145 domain-containing protein [Caulobacteraceae bacterium]